MEGLGKIGINANYNPNRLSDLTDVVVVLSGVATLRQAIGWKREGRIHRLLAGPNILVFPSDYPDLIAAPEVDLCLTPSNWISQLYESDCPSLKGRCAAWPAGVDTDYWKPTPHRRELKRVVVYKKTDIPILDACLQSLQQEGFKIDLLSYGSYRPAQYREALRRCEVLVGFTASESQGLAWAEAWSVDVPSLLWFQDHNIHRNRRFASSTAPYLSAQTGAFFRDPAEFTNLINGWTRAKGTFSPREWVLQNMSDEVSARHLCRLVGVSTAGPSGHRP